MQNFTLALAIVASTAYAVDVESYGPGNTLGGSPGNANAYGYNSGHGHGYGNGYGHGYGHGHGHGHGHYGGNDV